jgi:hypothetical protein
MNQDKRLSRADKIRLLQAIKDGRASLSALRGPQVYFFIETNKRPGVYIGPQGREYSQQEYEQFSTDMKAREDAPVIWYESKMYEV